MTLHWPTNPSVQTMPIQKPETTRKDKDDSARNAILRWIENTGFKKLSSVNPAHRIDNAKSIARLSEETVRKYKIKTSEFLDLFDKCLREYLCNDQKKLDKVQGFLRFLRDQLPCLDEIRKIVSRYPTEDTSGDKIINSYDDDPLETVRKELHDFRKEFNLLDHQLRSLRDEYYFLSCEYQKMEKFIHTCTNEEKLRHFKYMKEVAKDCLSSCSARIKDHVLEHHQMIRKHNELKEKLNQISSLLIWKPEL